MTRKFVEGLARFVVVEIPFGFAQGRLSSGETWASFRAGFLYALLGMTILS
jgi:hypothetical protein